MTIQRQYQATLINLEQEIDGFLGAAFIDMSTGQSLAAHSVRPGFDPSSVSAAGRAAVLSQFELINSLGTESKLIDVLVTSNDRIYVYQPISHQVFLYTAADREETNPALVKTVVNRFLSQYDSNEAGEPMQPYLSTVSRAG